MLKVILQGPCPTTVYDLRKDLRKIRRLPIEYFDTNSVGDVMSRAVNDISKLNTLQRSLSSLS